MAAVLPELLPAADGLLCPDHGATLAYRQDEDWTTRTECEVPGCGYEVTG